MTDTLALTFAETDLTDLATRPGRIALVVEPEGRMTAAVRRVNKLTRGAIARLVEDESWAGRKPGEVITLAWPQGLAAEALDVVVLPRKPDVALARRTGAKLGKLAGKAGALVLAGNLKAPEELALGLSLRAYDYGRPEDDRGQGRSQGSDHRDDRRSRGDDRKALRPAGRACGGGVLHPRPRQCARQCADHHRPSPSGWRRWRPSASEVEVLEEAGAAKTLGHGGASGRRARALPAPPRLSSCSGTAATRTKRRWR